MIETYTSDTDCAIEIPVKKDDDPGYWIDSYNYVYMTIKVVFRAGASSRPPWASLGLEGVDVGDLALYMQFSDAAGTIGLPGDDQWWAYCRLLLFRTDDVVQPRTLVWPGVDFSVVAAYRAGEVVADDTEFKALLAPPPVAIYLIDASGSMAAHVQDIAQVQLDVIRTWAEAPSVPARRLGVIVLKGGAFNVFPPTWDVSTVPDADTIVDQAKALLNSGAGNSPIGALVAKAQALVSAGHFTEPRYIGHGTLILVTDGKENGGLSPKVKVDDAAALAVNELRVWLGSYGYKLIVVCYDPLPDVWDPWRDAELIEEIDIAPPDDP